MKLSLVDELLLLSMRDGDGKRLIGGTELACGLAGATLADLVLDGLVTIEENKVVPAAEQADGPPTSGPHDDLYNRILEQTKPHKAAWWVEKLQSTKLVNERIESLVDRGLLKEEVVSFLGIFHRATYPENNPAPEAALRRRLDSVFAGASADEHLGVLVALMHATGLAGRLYPEVPKKRVEEIADAAPLGKAVKGTIDGMHAAIVAATTVATTAAVSAAT
ncbi:GOLPH3/VPS74 family protein [Spelaeicoccus albus]|uniref:Golgi phosphoprotein 3 GPP34 n=1 Tax=Spelaeicoccus albus TaxID=1280376 RepID=A0A7Z0D0H9_9MICO|nr:GPP34 family phosphoprotein [Spelaeicoccus albus]NYI67376.1 hypothetical protein [Spelaeicoccus albus]